MAYEWDNKKPTAQMLGRWQPFHDCLLYTSPSPRDGHRSRNPSSA